VTQPTSDSAGMVRSQAPLTRRTNIRVLVAYDGSDSSDQAVELVASVSWPAASEVRVVTAHPLMFPTSGPGEIVDAGSVQAIFDAERSEAERLATSAQRGVERPGLVAVSDERCQAHSGRPGPGSV
jgi:hypothetical protein